MSVLKNKKLLLIGAIVPLAVILLIIILFCINKYTLELSVTDGQVICLEYGTEINEPQVIAVYKGTIFNPKGIVVEVAADGEIDLKKLGEYKITYSANYKNKKTSAEVTVVVEDTTPPVIELVENPDYYTSPVATYEEEGYSAKDTHDGDITSLVIREETKDTVTYTVTDSSGNKSVKVRKIIYKDTVAPAIVLNDGTDITVGIGNDFTEPGYEASDDCDGDITQNVKIEGVVNTNEYGVYTLVYSVKDSSGNICQVERNVKVSDITLPQISLKGDKYVYIKLGSEYSEPGYTASDNVDGDITEDVKVSGSVDTSKEGNYSFTYQVSDSSGNTAKVVRNIYVYKKQANSSSENPGNKIVYLTFDDGPGKYTEKLLDILDKYGVKATFFVTNQYPKYQNLIGEEYRRGHTVALHTYSHKYSIYKSEETYYNDLKLISDICVAQTGMAPTIVRFPGGSSNKVSMSYCKGIMTILSKSLKYHGYLYCDWNVSSGDAGGTTSTDQVVENVINGIKKHNVSIVLQHDIKGYSVNAVERIIAWGLANGYTFLPMTESTPMVHHRINN